MLKLSKPLIIIIFLSLKTHYWGYEKQLLNQRGIIETVIGHLKHCYQVWHTRHRSVINAMTHLVAALAAYAIEPLKTIGDQIAIELLVINSLFGLKEFKALVGENFHRGIILCNVKRVIPIEEDIFLVPISFLWSPISHS